MITLNEIPHDFELKLDGASGEPSKLYVINTNENTINFDGVRVSAEGKVTFFSGTKREDELEFHENSAIQGEPRLYFNFKIRNGSIPMHQTVEGSYQSVAQSGNPLRFPIGTCRLARQGTILSQMQ